MSMLSNFIRQATSAPGGTGSLTLDTVSGYPTFYAVFGSSRYFAYAILLESDGTPLEIGIGHMSSETSLTRDRILATYTGGTYDDTAPSAVSLTNGTAYRVICTPEAGNIAATIHGIFDASSVIGAAGGNRKIYSDGANSPGSTRKLVANRQYLIPFLLNGVAEVNELGAYVSTGAADTNIRLGLYALRSDGYPETLIAESSIGLSSETNYTRIVSSIASMRLYPGWYATSIVSDGAPTIAAVGSGQYRNTPFGIPMAGNDSRGVISSLYQSLTYANTGALMPATFPTSGITWETSTVNPQFAIWLGLT